GHPCAGSQHDVISSDRASFRSDDGYRFSVITHIGDVEVADDVTSAGDYGFGQRFHELRWVQVALVLDGYAGSNLVGQGRLDASQFITGEQLVVDLASGLLNHLELVQQPVTILQGGEAGQERICWLGQLLHTWSCSGCLSNFVKSVQPGCSDFGVDAHGFFPLLGGRVPGKADEEAQQL